MKFFRLLITVTALVGLCALTSGCAVYKASVDERNLKEIVSDERISATITKELLEDKNMKVLDIDALTYNGHVYLIGEYDRSAQKTRAVAIARGVDGVTNVTAHLYPKKKDDLCGTTDNISIRGELDKALFSDDDIWATNVDVSVVQCHVILTGIVGSTTERSKAIVHARRIKSARSVTSYLTVK